MKRSGRLGTGFRLGLASLLAGWLGLGCGARTTIGQSDDGQGGFPNDAGVQDGPVDGPIYDQVNDINGCNPSTCGGCCTEEGACVTGLEATACGIGGYACVDCSLSNTSCNAATHRCGGQAGCGPATCSTGCCDAAGKCRSGTEQGACGSAGQQCRDCGTATICDVGLRSCVSPEACGPWNCKGCCASNGECSWGGDSWACGIGGVSCVDCMQSGQTCDAQALTCVTTQECAPWNCDGCCDASGECNWGGSVFACGAGGGACTDCATNGNTCDPQTHSCTAPGKCGPWNCEGCCAMDSLMCLSGTDSENCGEGGEPCAACGSGQQCTPQPSGGGFCSSAQPCGPWNCTGCCSNSFPSVCLAGTSWNACGFEGETCTQCPASSACQSTPVGGGTCASPPPDGGTGCGPWNCAGCCTQNGQCRPGTSNTRCGQGGVACQNCSAQNLTCSDGTCG